MKKYSIFLCCLVYAMVLCSSMQVEQELLQSKLYSGQNPNRFLYLTVEQIESVESFWNLLKFNTRYDVSHMNKHSKLPEEWCNYMRSFRTDTKVTCRDFLIYFNLLNKENNYVKPRKKTELLSAQSSLNDEDSSCSVMSINTCNPTNDQARSVNHPYFEKAEFKIEEVVLWVNKKSVVKQQ